LPVLLLSYGETSFFGGGNSMRYQGDLGTPESRDYLKKQQSLYL
jgi:hypothetical protein